MDPCECVCHYIWAMRRLMASVSAAPPVTPTVHMVFSRQKTYSLWISCALQLYYMHSWVDSNVVDIMCTASVDQYDSCIYTQIMQLYTFLFFLCSFSHRRSVQTRNVFQSVSPSSEESWHVKHVSPPSLSVALSSLSLSDPGYEGGVGTDPAATSYLLILLLWMVIAILLFLFRSVGVWKSTLYVSFLVYNCIIAWRMVRYQMVHDVKFCIAYMCTETAVEHHSLTLGSSPLRRPQSLRRSGGKPSLPRSNVSPPIEISYSGHIPFRDNN